MAQTVRESVASGRRAPYSRGRRGQKKTSPMSAVERRHLFQLVACGSMFVLLVTVKLLLPGKLDAIGQKVNAALRQNMDIQAVFSAIGEAASGQRDVGQALDEVYEAVFQPDTFSAYETAAKGADSEAEPEAMESLRASRTEEAADEAQEQKETAEVSTLAYVLYSNQNLPENACMEQRLLGFDYCTPADGPISSGFGYRDHPVEGEERFHYGVDIAAQDGSDVCSFADGTVKDVASDSMTLEVDGEDYKVLTGNAYVVGKDGIQAGAAAEVTYLGDLDDEPLAIKIVMNDAKDTDEAQIDAFVGKVAQLGEDGDHIVLEAQTGDFFTFVSDSIDLSQYAEGDTLQIQYDGSINDKEIKAVKITKK